MDYEKILKEALDNSSTPFEVQSWIEEQFPELRESEDKKMFKTIMCSLDKDKLQRVWNLNEDDVENWLKSLRPQSKQEWSDKDEKMVHHLENAIKYDKPRTYLNSKGIEITDVCDWLKSLRPQKHWKPSEEQMQALKEQCITLKSTETGARLCDLYHNLTKQDPSIQEVVDEHYWSMLGEDTVSEKPILDVIARWLDRVPNKEAMETKKAINKWFDVYYPEPVSDDLEKEIEESWKHLDLSFIGSDYEMFKVRNIVSDIANHFAYWKKQQMMKDAVQGFVNAEYQDVVSVKSGAIAGEERKKLGLHLCAKIKLIIIKEN